MYSKVSTSAFHAAHRCYPNLQYPDIQMLTVQQMQVLIATAKIDDNTHLEVSRIINGDGSKYFVYEWHSDSEGNYYTPMPIATAEDLSTAMSACHAHIRALKGEPIQEENKEFAYA